MRATKLEFRLRMAINSAIIILGFWAPWIEYAHIGKRVSLIEWLALQFSRLGIATFSAAISALIVIALFCALVAVVLRVSGTAWLGPTTVNSINMVAGSVMADGPYRFVRNPLYLGVWWMVAAMAFLMPVTGALFAIMLVTIVMIRLTLGEESYLSAQLGQPYQAYLRAVPRFIPRFRGAPPASETTPHWIRASLAELIPIGTLVGIIVFWRNYDVALAGRIILIFFGASLVASAFVPRTAVSPVPEKL
jgi:protein-S-isoprenylcysteine O-methyltransferase Ste14